MDDYDLLEVTYSDVTKLDKEKLKANCYEMMQEYKNHPEKEKIWFVLTSKGNHILMYGLCPV